MKITFNSPVILALMFLSAAVLMLFSATGTTFYHFFSTPTEFKIFSPFTYFCSVSHILGHKNWQHLLGNFLIILLVGPLVEEKYSSSKLLVMVVITALATGILNVFLFSTTLMGASGIAFMLIVLSSLTNFKAKEMPLTFLLVVSIFLGNEVLNSFRNNNISEFGHILGGMSGAGFGFFFSEKK